MVVEDEDFRALVKTVQIIFDNMELNYNAFRHARELDRVRKTLQKLRKKYPAPAKAGKG